MDYLLARRSGELTKQITTFCGVQEKPIADPILAMFAPSTGKAKIACAARRTSDGYAVEISVPAEQLDERRGGPWDALRLNVGVADFDRGRATTCLHRPSRFEPNAVWAGTFVRCDPREREESAPDDARLFSPRYVNLVVALLTGAVFVEFFTAGARGRDG
jgi:hypothetical protein